VKPYTPLPTVSIMTVEEEYSTYPAHASCSPVFFEFVTHFSKTVSASSPKSNTHSSGPGWYTPQMDPVGTAASMLLEPSMGSKDTRYPPMASATPTGTSSSSVTITELRALERMASQKMSLEMTSSFFCSSPDSLVESAKPTRPRMGAVATRLLMRLQATAMELMITAKSASM
jgi:hypothetical protein